MIRRLFAFPWRTKRAIRADVDTELGFHIDARTDALVAEGREPGTARAIALKEFGDVEDARRFMNSLDHNIETARRRRDYMGDLMQDVTYAIRKLKASPTFAFTVIITLAVGIGANTAVLNLINATLLKPPAVTEPSDVAWVSPVMRGGRYGRWSVDDYNDFRAATKSWSGVVAFGNTSLAIGGDEPAALQGMVVSGNYFDVLGVHPSPGRGFLAYEDSASSGAMPAVIGHALWVKRFSGDSGVIGKQILINSHEMTVVGIAPEGFNGMRVGEDNDIWIPLATLRPLLGARSKSFLERGSNWLNVVGRLSASKTFGDASAEAAVVAARLESEVTKPEDRRTLAVIPLRGGLDPSSRAKAGPILGLIMLVPLLVLGVACANVANLFVARSVQRQKEIAVRRALGASRGRIVRQLLTECAILGLFAGALGIVISYGVTAAVVQAGKLPPDITHLLNPDARVFALTFLIAIAAGAVFGLLPALAATRNSITPALKNDGIALQGGRGRHRLRNAFVVSQVALSLSLLITAGLFVGSLRKALNVDPGYDPENAIMMSWDLSAQGYDSARVAVFNTQVLERLNAAPGIEAAALAEVLPLSGSSMGTFIRREGSTDERERIHTFFSSVSDGFFAAMRIPIVKGRGFTAADDGSSKPVVVVNERLAALMWPGKDPIGQRFGGAGRPEDLPVTREVVGVVRDGKYRSLAEQVQEAYFWTPMQQRGPMAGGTLLVRSRNSTSEAVQAARGAIKALDPGLPMSRVATMREKIADSVDGQRGGAALLGVFGALALGLAAFGIFGVIAQGVSSRTREIGIRMSLGARAADVVRSFVREGINLTLVGTVIGVALSLAVSKILESLLFGLAPTDVLTFGGACVALLAVATLASFLPARRAAKVNPLIALRSD